MCQIENLVNCIPVRCITVPEPCLIPVFENDLLILNGSFLPAITKPLQVLPAILRCKLIPECPNRFV